MKILLIHSDFLEFEPKTKALKSAEEVKKVRTRVEECLVVFTSVEKGDEVSVYKNYVDEIVKVAEQVKSKKIVLYPWVHLSQNPSEPALALEVIETAKKELEEKDYDVIRAPFGWYKSFNISCKGHPLSELSREIKSETKGKVEVINAEKMLRDISKATLDRDKLKENDHRIIGQNLDLFSFYNVAPGMPFWHPKGLVIRNELIKFWREEHVKAGYQEIRTPQIMSDVLWKVSGHWDHYKENNFSTEYDKRPFMVKPMNCPGGMLVYKSKTRSYKEFPMRIGELGTVHRVELSGVLSGLFRVIQFTQDDAHIFCTEQQMEDEIIAVMNLIDKFYKIFGFSYRAELSTRPEKAMGAKEVWDKAEKVLEKCLKKKKMEFKINAGDGAFYGPKIDFHAMDSQGRSWQLSTIQLDFQMPERFQLKYIGEDGKEHTPVMLHRVIYGALERFIGILLEFTNGNLPLWLSPVQIKVVSFNEKNANAVEKIKKQLFDLGYRVESDTTSGTVQAKIRDAEMMKIPYIIVIGDKEEQANTLAIRKHGESKPKFGVKFEELAKELEETIKNKK